MMIMSFKLTKMKAVMCVVGAAVVLIGVIALVSQKNITASASIGNKSVIARTEEERVSYIESFGWSLDFEPVEIQEILLPKKMDDVLTAYNEIQKKQGFDLEKYAGKRVKRWTYTVLNYPGENSSEIRANIYTYKDKIIGGDISAAELDGFIHEINKYS